MEIIRTASGKEVIIYAETFDNATRTQILCHCSDCNCGCPEACV